jgi:hypothetical protein
MSSLKGLEIHVAVLTPVLKDGAPTFVSLRETGMQA